MAEIVTFEIDTPIVRGLEVVVYVNTAKSSGTIAKLNKLLIKENLSQKKFPKWVVLK